MSEAELIDATCSHRACADKGTYDLAVQCSNCDWKGTARQTKGHHQYQFVCPRCDCETVRRVVVGSAA